MLLARDGVPGESYLADFVAAGTITKENNSFQVIHRVPMALVRRSSDTSQLMRGQMIALHNEGYSQGAISERLKVSRKAIRKAISSPDSKRSACGRLRKSTERQDRVL